MLAPAQALPEPQDMLDKAAQDETATAADWLERLARAVAEGGDVSGLFLDDCYWRDAVALTWDLQTLCGASTVAPALAAALAEHAARAFRLDPSDPAPRLVTRAGSETIEAFFRFETGSGDCRGLVRLRRDGGGGYRAWTLLSELDALKGHEEQVGDRRPSGHAHARDFRGPNWLDKRNAARAYQDREPAVLVVGAGQAGLSIAARLGRLGVDTLLVDRHQRIGDNWRKRYHALTLHNQVQVNHLPYMPFPPSFPTYIPKDMLANWFEAYAEAMELNCWTASELSEAAYDEDAGVWSATVRRDGEVRRLRPRHIVMATGVSGIPNRPEIASLENFKGPVQHSSEYQDGEDWAGARAIVIGTGNSGHDIAQDLWSSGAEVAIVQRSPTLIVSLEPSAQLPYALYGEGLPLEDCDLIVTGTPVPLSRRAHVDFTQRSREIDKPLLDRLEAKGFRLDLGEDGTGWQFKYLTRGGGYYFDVGCSGLIADGEIRLLQFDDIRNFTAAGATLLSGEELGADLIVLATGYQPQEKLVEKLFGEAVADRIGPIWGFGDGLELRNMFKHTAQPGLWFIAGSLAQCRINSKYLALQIKAAEEGLAKTA